MTYRTFIFLSLCLSLFGCHKFETLDDLELPPHKAKLVVFANLTTDGGFEFVYVYKTRSSLDTSNSMVIQNDSVFRDSVWQVYSTFGIDTVNATVELYRNGQLFETIKRYNYGSFNRYELSKHLRADGATYTLRVSAAGFETVEAVQIMPKTIKLDSVKFLRKGLVFKDLTSFPNAYEFACYFKDGGGDSLNFYSTYIGGFSASSSDLLNLDPSVNTNVLNDNFFNGKPFAWHVFYPNLHNSKLKGGGSVELRSTTRDAYLFNKSAKLYFETRNNQFAEPTTLYSNIKNGYGIFTLSAVSEYYLQF
jgi:hypothetical protein